MERNRTWICPAARVVAIVALAAIGLVGMSGCHRSASQAPASQPAVTVAPVAKQDDIYLYFSPRGNATQAIIEQIDQARQTLLIQAYQFTSAPIAKAVLEAHKRGVQVTVILDPTQEGNRGPGLEGGPHYSSAQFLYNQGIHVFIDRKHDIAHNKIMLIDGRVIITGSFNFTKAAQERNAENMLILFNKSELYAAYERNFREHLKHSIPYEGHETKETAPRKSQRRRMTK